MLIQHQPRVRFNTSKVLVLKMLQFASRKINVKSIRQYEVFIVRMQIMGQVSEGNLLIRSQLFPIVHRDYDRDGLSF